MTQHTHPVFVITGAAGGMGRACARRIGTQGLLLLTDAVAEPLEQMAHELRTDGFQVETQVSDITDAGFFRTLAERARALGPLRGIVHTAGIGGGSKPWQRIIQVDLVGTARLLQAFLPLAEPGTAVVCIASMAGYLGAPKLVAQVPDLAGILGSPLREDLLQRLEPVVTAAAASAKENPSGTAYTLAKYGVIHLCQNEATAWGERGARLVSLSPGIIQTAQGLQELDRQPIMKMMIAKSPLKRMGKPEEIASAVEFLLSSNASFITGCDLLVDGGVTAVMPTILAQTPQPGHAPQDA